MEQRRLSAAQQRRLKRLVDGMNAAQRELNEFVAYLQEEHDASPADGWVIRAIEDGFVREGGDDDNGT
jgi:hypothetical protein